ncbi:MULTISPECIES: porin family protein [unclassified Acinetobacter]|uniref:outer membrane protein n=1 Tax=unclassified Acinetobacter TaxID=196816 RepID=UPI0029352667|nr:MULTISPECIES: porin family protein [unclassified Acinetobacter]WOE32231.1 porin family protein [Acinetobacter sp. SAAs470]WOE37701.1 porin family protein [Acinetobacter sp. SAAs474]
MKKILLASVVLLSFSGLANADNGVYASLKAGISDTKYRNSEDVKTNNVLNTTTTWTNDNQTKAIYPAISAAVGFDFSAISPINARAELEYTYKDKETFSPTADYKTIVRKAESTGKTPFGEKVLANELRSQSLMLNGYYDFKNTSKFTPYVGVGVGITRVKNQQTEVESNSSISSTKNHFTWSAGVGVAYSVTDNVALDLSYKYVDAGKFKFNNNVENGRLDTKVDLRSQDYALGIRYNF